MRMGLREERGFLQLGCDPGVGLGSTSYSELSGFAHDQRQLFVGGLVRHRGVGDGELHVGGAVVVDEARELRAADGQLAARAYVKVAMLDKDGKRLRTAQVMDALGVDPVSPPLPEGVLAWQASDYG